MSIQDDIGDAHNIAQLSANTSEHPQKMVINKDTYDI